MKKQPEAKTKAEKKFDADAAKATQKVILQAYRNCVRGYEKG